MKAKDNSYKTKIIFMVALCFIVFGTALQLVINFKKGEIYVNNEIEVHEYFSDRNNTSLYLSDIEYIKNQSAAGWDQIRYNETNGGKITLKIENGAFTFEHGIWAHATSQVTYDISEYNYRYFTAFIGLNTTSSKGNGVHFYVYTSEDGTNWGEAKYNEVKLPGKEASFIAIELENAHYLRLVADCIGRDNAADHSVWADAKLTNTAETSSIFKSVAEYDEIIRGLYSNQADLTGEIEFNLLKRQLISQVGQFTINAIYNASEENKEALDFLMSNQKALKYYILGGKPGANNYYKSLTEYSRLYKNYKNDFNNTEVTKYGTELGDLYLRMATSLSLTHSGLVGLWMNNASTPENQSDSVRRYAIIKYMHKNNLFEGPEGVDYNTWFEKYTVEEMRYVMANNIDDQSMLWLNAYVRELIKKEGGSRLWPHKYIAYVWPNYGNPVFYAEENKDYFNQLFSVPDEEHEGQRIGLWDLSYTIPGGVDEPEYTLQIPRGTSNNKIYKVWMNMRNKFGTGAVCGGISKVGSNIRGVLGLPDAVVGQPGHAAHINYFRNSKGEGYWGIDNDVSGWAYTGSSGLLGWANGPYASGYTGTYIQLAQEVVNHFDIYEQSQKFVYLADTFTDLTKKEELYRKALEIQPLNLNAWYGLILAYNASGNKTEEQYYELAKEIAVNLKYYPLPMYQMTNQIKPKLTSLEESYKFTLLQTRILKEASVTPNNSTEVLQPSITKLMANFILGQMDTTIATFSFDGEDAGKIVLSSRFDGNGVRWDYSIDGKNTWKEVSFSAEEEHKLQLTQEEIDSMTSENDLYIHIVGVNYAEENLYKIDLRESRGLPETFFASDSENKLLGATDSVEWKYNDTDNWNRYGDKQPELTGDKTVIVRMGATGTYLASPASSIYIFTEDVVNNKRKYIPVEHLALEAVSSEAVNNGGSASFAIDANYKTRWHSAWNGSDNRRFITVKLDKPRYISAVEFVPAAGGNGKIYDGTVWGSMDGENWIVLSQLKGLTYTNSAELVEQAIANTKSFDVEEPQKVQYVKIVADRTNGNWFTARAFNFYEDTTAKAVGTFSFDGTNARKIVLYDEYENVNWKYSLDNGATWETVNEKTKQLSDEELEKINDQDKIKLIIDGDSMVYTINIRKGESPARGYLNDLENRPIAQPDKNNLEWKISGESCWTNYAEQEPNVQGNNTLYVRKKATGNTTASDPIEYEFTEDSQPSTARYVSIQHLSVEAYSNTTVPSRGEEALFSIDGLPTTMWHTNRTTTTMHDPRWIVIKLDEARYISKIQYVRKDKYMYGILSDGVVSTSMDGTNWEIAATVNDLFNVSTREELANTDNSRDINFTNVKQAQYVKIELTKSYDWVFGDRNGQPMDYFFSAAMFNLFEDVTKYAVPTAEIEYDIKNNTNQNVTAKLVNPSTEIRITNNGGKDTYTFESNGEFEFEFVDGHGKKGKAKAKVDWIIKTLPVTTVIYNTTQPTNQNVIAEISFDRDKTRIVDDEGNTIQEISLGEKYIVEFTENSTKKINFIGPYGNAGSKTLNVDWIDKEVPIATIEYSSTTPTNKDVVATIKFNEENVTVTSEGGNKHTFTTNDSFEFSFQDQAGNQGTAIATVNWIDRQLAMPTIEYSTTKPTNKDVVATITFDKENVVVQGGNTHTFTENGTYEFKFIGPAGNEGTAVAKVDWIDKTAPEAMISYNPTNFTNQDVTATIEFNEENVKIINNDGKADYTFVENGQFEFIFEDQAGNQGKATAVVNIIDKVAPKASVKYSIQELTNQDVIVTLVNESETITITSEGGNTHTFTENGEFTFEFVDRAGNQGSVVAKVDWIDKEAPVGKISYDITDKTNQDVIATISFDEENVTVTSEGGNTHVFTENNVFTFTYVDALGNIGTAEAEVTWINKNAPVGTIKYSIETPTNQEVVATLEVPEGVVITSEGGNTHTFTENASFIFTFKDEYGNTGTAEAEVTWINKNAPIGTIKYSIETPTNQDVIATLEVPEGVVITSEGGNTHTFTQNDKFVFRFVDTNGNEGSAVAEVTWINKVSPVGSIKYSIETPTNQDVVATLEVPDGVVVTSEGGNTHTFTENASFIFTFKDEYGNIGTAEAEVTWINKVAPVGTIKYSIETPTNQDVIATLEVPEGVVITSEGGNTHTFTENASFIFTFKDEYGNIGTAEAEVTWINKNAPIGTIKYSIETPTSQNVIATLEVPEGVVITSEGGDTHTFTKNGSFTFTFVDSAGNEGSVVAKVDWIKKEVLIVPTYITNEVTQEVEVTLKLGEGITITNNGGLSTYTFTENGEFTFKYETSDGERGNYVVKVDWIHKKVEEPAQKDEPIHSEQPSKSPDPSNGSVVSDVPRKPIYSARPNKPNYNDNIVDNPNQDEENRKNEDVNDTNTEDRKPENNDSEDNVPDNNKSEDNQHEENKKVRKNNYIGYVLIVTGIMFLGILSIRLIRKKYEKN